MVALGDARRCGLGGGVGGDGRGWPANFASVDLACTGGVRRGPNNFDLQTVSALPCFLGGPSSAMYYSATMAIFHTRNPKSSLHAEVAATVA